MISILGLALNTQGFVPALVLGFAVAGLYGMLAVTLVLTYRVSRTVGFIWGGVALFSAFFYFWLTASATGEYVADTERVGPGLASVPSAILVVVTGALVGAAYGFTVTGKRMANWPRVTITSYSLGCLLVLAGLTGSLGFTHDERRAPSMFGSSTVQMFGVSVTRHQLATLVLLIVVVGFLGVVLRATRTGLHVRAIADDVEASRLLGIPLSSVGTGVYASSGALAALAGVLLASTVGTSVVNILFVFLRALLVAVLGGFTSLPLALAGCFLLGASETMLTAGVFGLVSVEQRELIVMGTIFGLVFLINRLRPVQVLEATGQ